MLNKIIVMGRLARDPELRHTQSGVKVTTFTLAIDRDFKDKSSGERETDWLDVVAWRQAGEFASTYFAKGRVAVVEGRLQSRSYTDRDGIKRKAVEIVADQLYFGDSKPADQRAREGIAPVGHSPLQQNENFTDLIDADGALPF